MTLFEMDETPETALVKAEYLDLADRLFNGVDPCLATPMKDRALFDFLGFD